MFATEEGSAAEMKALTLKTMEWRRGREWKEEVKGESDRELWENDMEKKRLTCHDKTKCANKYAQGRDKTNGK